jgi:hypothetical protein
MAPPNNLANPAPAHTAPLPPASTGDFFWASCLQPCLRPLVPAIRQAGAERRAGMGSAPPASGMRVLN